MKSYHVTLPPQGLAKSVPEGARLDHVIREAGLNLNSSCGGKGRCGKCRVVLSQSGVLQLTPNEIERDHISTELLKRGIRLACQTDIRCDLTVKVAQTSVAGEIQGVLKGIERKVEPSPFTKQFHIDLHKSDIQPHEADFERLVQLVLRENSYPALIAQKPLSKLSETMRNPTGRVTVTIWNDREVIDVEEDHVLNGCFGVAVDVGTTKIAVCLIDLNTGNVVDTEGDINAQSAHGDDVLVRIEVASSGKVEAALLQKEAVDTINRLISRICLKHDIDPRHIYQAVVVGNTAMHHILLGIFPEYLSLSPYAPTVTNALDRKGKDLNLNMNHEGYIHFPPLISGFVGSDCLANILATELHESQGVSLLLDIGTNTEIVLVNDGRILSCSGASGPAFEGGGIKHGMKAVKGAIERVTIDPVTGGIVFKTIGGSSPRGICGSGVIDCIAAMIDAGIIDKKGLFIENVSLPCVRPSKDGGWEICITKSSKDFEDIVLTQKDVGEIQVAKAAVRAGISVLMETEAVDTSQIDRILISGSFGSRIDPQSALSIGILPNVPLEIIELIGNAALEGAKMALISDRIQHLAQKIAEDVEHVELADSMVFQQRFIEALGFPCLRDR
jgi:uncharacterized 2Fe-2S/4Fe-4S cluster protein (DUF4445 family)